MARGRKHRGKPSVGGAKDAPSPRSRTSRGSHATAAQVRWVGIRPMYDFWGVEIKRFYRLETLVAALERMLGTSGNLIESSFCRILGPAPLRSLTFELFQEGRYALIFRVRAANARRKLAALGLVVAKNHQELSAIAAAEHQNLRIVCARAPQFVVRPYDGGRIHLPDSPRSRYAGRQVYAYLTQWLGGYHELGITKNLQFFINTAKPRVFSVAETEQLKAQMVEIIARTYDAANRDCMAMPEVASGDFVVTKPQRGPLRLKLIACRRMEKKVSPAKLLQTIAASAWDWGGRPFRIMPSDLDLFFEALANARGTEEAGVWAREYVSAVKSGKLREQCTLPLESMSLR